MKSIDLFLGIKAEQTLRDAVRAEAEASTDGASGSELCPVGRKDWIAGERIGSSREFGNMATLCDGVLSNLIQLKSHQRVRRESLRVYAVRKPVPVFKDPIPESLDEIRPAPVTENTNTAVICSVCQAEVNSFNIQYDPRGNIVGCYLCRGDPGLRNGSLK
ncbi:MAG: hypothetical protein QNJ97_23550 [Myxococcota bacterium]|nr:hypothetical protein [Myxococcota bacterium]